MSTRQRKQLQRVIPAIGALLPELDPRVIEPSAEKQKELGIAEETLLLRIGPHRVISVSATESGAWSIKEFDAKSGDLVPIWEETGELSDSELGPMLLGAAVGSLEEQLAAKGDTAVHKDLRTDITGVLDLLRERQRATAGEGAVA